MQWEKEGAVSESKAINRSPKRFPALWSKCQTALVYLIEMSRCHWLWVTDTFLTHSYWSVTDQCQQRLWPRNSRYAQSWVESFRNSWLKTSPVVSTRIYSGSLGPRPSQELHRWSDMAGIRTRVMGLRKWRRSNWPAGRLCAMWSGLSRQGNERVIRWSLQIAIAASPSARAAKNSGSFGQKTDLRYGVSFD